MVLLIIYAAEKGAISRLLLSAPARLLGTLSYSIYMVHLFVMGRLLDVLKVLSPHFGGQIVQPDGHGGKMIQAAWYVGDGWTLVLLALVLPAAWLLSLCGMPARALSRRLVDGKRPVAHAVPVEG
jgi:peptidoglycan/LPS O-acetylase OafA/YrhL